MHRQGWRQGARPGPGPCGGWRQRDGHPSSVGQRRRDPSPPLVLGEIEGRAWVAHTGLVPHAPAARPCRWRADVWEFQTRGQICSVTRVKRGSAWDAGMSRLGQVECGIDHAGKPFTSRSTGLSKEENRPKT